MPDLLKILKKRTSLLRSPDSASPEPATATEPSTQSLSPSHPVRTPALSKSQRSEKEFRLPFGIGGRQASRESSSPPSSKSSGRSPPPPPIEFVPPCTPRRGRVPSDGLDASPSRPTQLASISSSSPNSRSKSGSFLRSFRIPSSLLSLSPDSATPVGPMSGSPSVATTQPPSVRGRISSPLPFSPYAPPEAVAGPIVPYPELVLVTPSGSLARPAWSPDNESLLSVIDIPAQNPGIARQLDLGDAAASHCETDEARRLSHTGTFGHLLDISAIEAQLAADQQVDSERERDQSTDVDSPGSVLSVWAKDGSADERLLCGRQVGAVEIIDAGVACEPLQRSPSRRGSPRRSSRKQVPRLSDLDQSAAASTVSARQTPPMDMATDGGADQRVFFSSPVSVQIAGGSPLSVAQSRPMSRATNYSANKWYMREKEEALELLDGIEAVRRTHTPESTSTVTPRNVIGRSTMGGDEEEEERSGMEHNGFGSSYSISEFHGHPSSLQRVEDGREGIVPSASDDGHSVGLAGQTTQDGFGSSYSLGEVLETMSSDLGTIIPLPPPKSPLRQSLPNLRISSAATRNWSTGVTPSADGSGIYADTSDLKSLRSPINLTLLSDADRAPLTPPKSEHRRANSAPLVSPSLMQYDDSFLDLTLTSPMTPTSPRVIEFEGSAAHERDFGEVKERILSKKASYAGLGRRDTQAESMVSYDSGRARYVPPDLPDGIAHDDVRAAESGARNGGLRQSNSRLGPLPSLVCPRVVSTASGISITVTEASVSPPRSLLGESEGRVRLSSDTTRNVADESVVVNTSLESLGEVALAMIGDNVLTSMSTVALSDAAKEPKFDLDWDSDMARPAVLLAHSDGGPRWQVDNLLLNRQRSATAPDAPVRMSRKDCSDPYKVSSPYVDLGGSIASLGFPENAAPFPHPRKPATNGQTMATARKGKLDLTFNRLPAHAAFARAVQPAAQTFLCAPITCDQMSANLALLMTELEQMRLAWDGTLEGRNVGIRKVMRRWREEEEARISSAISLSESEGAIDLGFRLTLAELEDVYTLAFEPMDRILLVIPFLNLHVGVHKNMIEALLPLFMGLMRRRTRAETLAEFVVRHVDKAGRQTWSEHNGLLVSLLGPYVCSSEA